MALTFPSTQQNLPEKPPSVIVGDIPVDRLRMDEAVQWIVRRLDDRQARSPMMIMCPNAQLVTLARSNMRFRRALWSAHLNVPDGISVVLAARFLGMRISQRVPGGELMERLCAECSSHGFTVFFLGGLPGAAHLAAQHLKRNYPGLHVVGCCCPPYGFENSPDETRAVRRQIAEQAPDVLFIAFGAPKQELWLHENCAALPIGAAVTVGGALDTCAGLRKRAPRWTHDIGLEWLYRLVREPRRLWRRYLIGNSKFISLVARQLARRHLARLSITRPAKLAHIFRKGF